jgi:hypothetical protein
MELLLDPLRLVGLTIEGAAAVAGGLDLCQDGLLAGCSCTSAG